MNPLVSICIPTYRQTHLLEQNLDAIVRQTYRQIEVLVSDDSPGTEVEGLVQTYRDKLPLAYIRNQPALGSPANWNAVLKRAKGDFVLLLHHDDQFAEDDSLDRFLAPLLNNAAVDFSFGRNEGIDAIAGTTAFAASYFNRYYRDPSFIVLANTLGAPSNVLLRREALALYDERFKWIVDIEYYFRLFKLQRRFAYVDEHLIKTGRHEGQVTNEVINNSDILLYENITFAIENIKRPGSMAVFDFYWRLLRNNRVRTIGRFETAGIAVSSLPGFIRTIVKVQSRLPAKVLRSGPLSKFFMSLTYLGLR